jgi:hypothetical protein
LVLKMGCITSPYQASSQTLSKHLKSNMRSTKCEGHVIFNNIYSFHTYMLEFDNSTPSQWNVTMKKIVNPIILIMMLSNLSRRLSFIFVKKSQIHLVIYHHHTQYISKHSYMEKYISFIHICFKWLIFHLPNKFMKMQVLNILQHQFPIPNVHL